MATIGGWQPVYDDVCAVIFRFPVHGDGTAEGPDWIDGDVYTRKDETEG